MQVLLLLTYTFVAAQLLEEGCRIPLENPVSQNQGKATAPDPKVEANAGQDHSAAQTLDFRERSYLAGEPIPIAVPAM